jgi:hypothetical protein
MVQELIGAQHYFQGESFVGKRVRGEIKSGFAVFL